jgi:hypothetical protein
MTPVISPLWFWLFDICGSCKVIFELLLGACALGCILTGAGLFTSTIDGYESEVLKFKSMFKKMILVTIPIFTLAVVIPKTDTLTKMLIAQNVTYERVEAATDTVQTVYNDIMELFEDKGETE